MSWRHRSPAPSMDMCCLRPRCRTWRWFSEAANAGTERPPVSWSALVAKCLASAVETVCPVKKHNREDAAGDGGAPVGLLSPEARLANRASVSEKAWTRKRTTSQTESTAAETRLLGPFIHKHDKLRRVHVIGSRNCLLFGELLRLFWYSNSNVCGCDLVAQSSKLARGPRSRRPSFSRRRPFREGSPESVSEPINSHPLLESKRRGRASLTVFDPYMDRAWMLAQQHFPVDCHVLRMQVRSGRIQDARHAALPGGAACPTKSYIYVLVARYIEIKCDKHTAVFSQSKSITGRRKCGKRRNRQIVATTDAIKAVGGYSSTSEQCFHTNAMKR